MHTYPPTHPTRHGGQLPSQLASQPHAFFSTDVCSHPRYATCKLFKKCIRRAV